MSLEGIQTKVLHFWFGEPSSPDYGGYKSFWFQSSPVLDAQIRKQFADIYEEALNGKLSSLSESPEGSLALILLLDQFPRNMYRGTPQAFLSDPQAVKITKEAVSKKFDGLLNEVQRLFFYMPFQHSESLVDQEKSVELFKTLKDASSLKYAIEHYELIKRFGRFPHRNKILGRTNTLDETLYLNSESVNLFGQ